MTTGGWTATWTVRARLGPAPHFRQAREARPRSMPAARGRLREPHRLDQSGRSARFFVTHAEVAIAKRFGASRSAGAA